jgi:ABC-type sugar transport system permease subunit
MATVAVSHSTARPRTRAFRRAVTGYVFLLPALVLIATFTFYPFARLIVLSFQSWDGVGLDTPWVGTANYERVLADTIFWASVLNVVKLGVALYLIGNGISLGMALAVNSVRRGGSFYRVVYYLPGVFSPVVVGLMFAWLLQPSVGLLNRSLTAVGLSMLTNKWLNDPATALPSVAGVYIWYHWGFGFLLFLAGLQGVPRELYEAASIDGAGVWARFRHITWPQLLPITTIISVLTLSAALQIFATVQVMTNGGPGYLTEVPILRIYKEMLSNHRYGVAAAMSVIFGAMLVALSIAQIMIWRRQSGGSDEVE